MFANEWKYNILSVKRVSTATKKNTRNPNFSVMVAASSGPGVIGLGKGKSLEIGDAIRNAENSARRHAIYLTKDKKERKTVPYTVTNKFSSTRIILKPAEGTGLKAAKVTKDILELAGIKHATCKILGSRNKVNVARCLVEALQKIQSVKKIAIRRDIDINKILADRYMLLTGKEPEVRPPRIIEKKPDQNRTQNVEYRPKDNRPRMENRPRIGRRFYGEKRERKNEDSK